MNARIVMFGTLFGFVLSRAGATDYDAIAGMFQFTDLHLAWVIVTAIAGTALGIAVIRKRKLHSLRGEAIELTGKPWRAGLAGGALLFGAGWAVSGTCPGTALAQLGEGRFAAIATLAGILFGAYLAQRSEARGSAPQRRNAASRALDEASSASATNEMRAHGFAHRSRDLVRDLLVR